VGVSSGGEQSQGEDGKGEGKGAAALEQECPEQSMGAGAVESQECKGKDKVPREKEKTVPRGKEKAVPRGKGKAGPRGKDKAKAKALRRAKPKPRLALSILVGLML